MPTNSPDAANEPDYGAIDVPETPVTDEEIAELPTLDPALLDPPTAWREES